MAERKPAPRKRAPRRPPAGTVEIDPEPVVGKKPPNIPMEVAPVDIDLDVALVGRHPPKTSRLRVRDV